MHLKDVYLPPVDTVIPVFEVCPFIDLKALLKIFPPAEKKVEDYDYQEDYNHEDYDYHYDYGNAYEHIKHMVPECYPPGKDTGNWAWSDYSWSGYGSDSPRWMELVQGRTDVDVHSMGIGTLCNALPGSNGITQDAVKEGDAESAELWSGAGAFFLDRSTRYYTESSLAAGAELFLEYGDEYYESRKFAVANETSAVGHRSLEYLEKHGKCLDNVLPGPSHIGSHAGQGAFASRSIPKDSVIAPLPVIYIIDDQEGFSFDLYDVIVEC